MKNLHVLPTDKPTWLHKSTLTGVLRKSSSCIDDMKQAQGMNIYITSDEEIKDGDWVISIEGIWKNTITKIIGVPITDVWKKIILTTDQDLIKDGVQFIDDEFLEWFVNNPSCESVEIVGDNCYYEIIIPKEEPKFENSIQKTIDIIGIANSMFGKKEETKQETLAERKAQAWIDFAKTNEDVNMYSFVRGFDKGAKWQQEQDKNKFSEEEIRNIAEASFSFYRTNEFSDDELELEVEWRNWLEKRIEQLKKK